MGMGEQPPKRDDDTRPCTWYEYVGSLLNERDAARKLLREAYNELNTIDAITVSPSDTDGLIELLRRIREHLGDKE